jgi:hypothetical protein
MTSIRAGRPGDPADWALPLLHTGGRVTQRALLLLSMLLVQMSQSTPGQKALTHFKFNQP